MLAMNFHGLPLTHSFLILHPLKYFLTTTEIFFLPRPLNIRYLEADLEVFICIEDCLQDEFNDLHLMVVVLHLN